MKISSTDHQQNLPEVAIADEMLRSIKKLKRVTANHHISPVHLIWDLESLHLIQSFTITSVGSSGFQKNLQRLDQPTLVILFRNEKFLNSKKNTTMGFKWCFDPIVVFFF